MGATVAPVYAALTPGDTAKSIGNRVNTFYSHPIDTTINDFQGLYETVDSQIVNGDSKSRSRTAGTVMAMVVPGMKAKVGLTKFSATMDISNFAEGKLVGHFNKHVINRAEWGTKGITIDQYLNKARSLLNSQVKGDIDGFVSKEGWVFRYNTRTNELATAKPDGTIETLFRPKDGINYWNDQVLKYKSN